MEDGSVEIYSRNAERNTGKYPDVVDAVSRYSPFYNFTYQCISESPTEEALGAVNASYYILEYPVLKICAMQIQLSWFNCSVSVHIV